MLDRREWLAMSAAASLSGCSGRTEIPRGIRTLRIGVAQTVAAMATLSLGEEQGYFREAGLAIEPTITSSAATLLPSLVSGKLDLYIGSLTPALLTPEVIGAGVRIAMARDMVKPGCSTWGSIYGLKRSFPGGLADLRELKGKKIAFTNRGGITEYGLDLIVAAAGLKDGDVEGVVLRQAEAMGALAAGRIDGVFVLSFSPLASGEVAEQAALFPAVERFAPGFQSAFILFGSALRGPERNAGVAFLRAYQQSSKSFSTGKSPKNFDDLAKKNGLDPATSRASCRDTAAPGGVVDVENIQRYADWALRKKYIETAVKAQDIVDSKLATEAGA